MWWGSHVGWRGDPSERYLAGEHAQKVFTKSQSGSLQQREPPVRIKRTLEQRQSIELHAKHQDRGLSQKRPILPSKIGVPGAFLEDASCQKAVGAFFKCLDRASGGYGYVDGALALRLWPTLAQHVDGAGAKAIERKLQQRREPISQKEWLELMSSLCSMSGVRLFLSSVLNAWVLFEQGSGAVARPDILRSPPCCNPGSQNNLFFAQAERSLDLGSRSSALTFDMPSLTQERVARTCSLPSLLPPLNCMQQPAIQKSAAKSPKTGDHSPSVKGSSMCLAGEQLMDEKTDNFAESIDSQSVSTAEEEQKQESDLIVTITPAVDTSDRRIDSASVDVKQAMDSPDSTLPALQLASRPRSPSGESVIEDEVQQSTLHQIDRRQARAVDVTPEQSGSEKAVLPTCEVAGSPDVRFAASGRSFKANEVLEVDLETGETYGGDEVLSAPPADDDLVVEAITSTEASTADSQSAREPVDADEELMETPSKFDSSSEIIACKVAKRNTRIQKLSSTNRKSNSQAASKGAKKRNGLSPPYACPRQAARRGPSEPLPALPRVPIAVPSSVRIAKAVAAWKTKHLVKLRAGNVFKVIKDFWIGSRHVDSGTWGRVHSINEDGSAEIVLDEDDLTSEVSKDDLVNFDVQIVTHEVKLINRWGQPMGKALSCIVTAYHSDGYLDILCQDGRQQRFVHSAFMRELPEAEFSDVGYSGCSSPKTMSSSFWGQQTVQERIAQRLVELHDGQDVEGGITAELPPAGYLGSGAGVACPGMFAMGWPLNADRAKPKVAQLEESCEVQAFSGQDGCRSEAAPSPLKETGSEAPGPDQGSSICPFVEIGDGGLRDMIASCAFTSQDTVFDVGAGRGKMLNKILETYPCRGVAVELNKSLAKIAEQNLRRYGDRAAVVLDDIRNVDLKEATAVVSYMLSHSFNSQGAALKEHLAKSLRPGCVVLNSTYPVPGWCGSYKSGVYRYTIGEHLPDDGH